VKLLLIPTSDWIRHPIPSRLHFIFERLCKDHEIHVIHFENFRWNIIRDTKLVLHKVPGIPFKDLAINYAINSPFHYSKIQRLVDEEKIDAIVYAHVLAGSASILAAHKHNIPVICDYLDHFPESASIYYDNAVIKKIVHDTVSAITNWNLKNTDLTITVSSGFAEKLTEKGIKNVFIVPNGVENDKFYPMPRKDALNKVGLKHLENKFIILYVGSIERWVDLEGVIEGIQILTRLGIPAVLLCVGGSIAGKYYDEVSKYSEVVFTGFVDYSLVPYYINASNACVLPLLPMDKNLTIPLKLLQYFACGRPVFSLPNKELEQRFSSATTFYNNPEEFSKFIFDYINNPDQYGEKIENGLLISKNYSWDDLSKNYEHMLNRLIKIKKMNNVPKVSDKAQEVLS